MSIRLSEVLCPTCNRIIKESEYVLLDFVYTLSHQECYDSYEDLLIAAGTYKEVAKEFPFFYEDLLN
ncbi:hypothetical protein [Cytobacillus oceanisediminis]|uniref:hypothetical protein n=1 Tax=Cytobacillus oceanisediminis TaxID=665099 RepID=UPI00373606C1